MDLNEMALFTEIVESKGFTAASKRTGVPLSTISRKMASLESRLGVRLVQRSTRHVKLTEIGENYYQHCRRMLDEALEAEEMIQNMSDEPSGTLRVATPYLLDSLFASNLLLGFLQKYPKINVEVEHVKGDAALIESGFDCGIRFGKLADSSNVVRGLGCDHVILCASPEYLRKHGTPKNISDLSSHLGLEYQYQTFEFEHQGNTVSLPLQRRFICDDPVMLRRLAIDSVGICFLPKVGCAEQLEQRQLVQILPDIEQVMDVSLVYPSRRQLSTKLRTFIDYVVERCESEATWEFLRSA